MCLVKYLIRFFGNNEYSELSCETFWNQVNKDE